MRPMSEQTPYDNKLLAHLSEEDAGDYHRITERIKDQEATFTAEEVRQYVIYLAKLYSVDPEKILRYTYLPKGSAASNLMVKLALHVSRLQRIVR